MTENWMKKARFLPILMPALLATACTQGTGPKELGGPSITLVPSAELPGPNGETRADQQYAFVIGPYDKLVIDVLGIEELKDRRFQVDGSGTITLPIGGEVSLEGLTLGEARNRISGHLRAAHVREPQVSVNIEEATSQYVTVDGQVKEPGNYPIVADMTLMRAIAAAKGATEFAKLDDVVILRTVNDRKMIALYQLSHIRRGTYDDPVIYPRDTIVVGDSPSRRLFLQVLQIVPALASPLVAIFDNNN